MTKRQLPIASFLLASLVVAAPSLSGCGKRVDQEALQSNPSPQNRPPTLTEDCGPGHTAYWDFIQPQATEKKSVDLLFVVDTSASMDDKRSRLATSIPDFITKLDPNTDYRMGVMLAHGGASRYSGRLYSATGVPKILNSNFLSPAQVRTFLTEDLQSTPVDVDEANGEMGMYSFSKSLEPDALARMKRQGFYRDEAALSVVFVTDENDICYRPELHGYSSFPDFVPSYQNSEVVAYDRYCLKADGTEAITPEAVYAQAQALKSNGKLSLSGIVHVDPARVPQGNGPGDLEDSIGHGILELVRLAVGNVVMDVMDSSYQAGLGQLAGIITSQLRLDTSFSLASTDGLTIRPETVSVQVDGVAVNRQFDEVHQRVILQPQDAGKAGSKVRVAACKQ